MTRAWPIANVVIQLLEPRLRRCSLIESKLGFAAAAAAVEEKRKRGLQIDNIRSASQPALKKLKRKFAWSNKFFTQLIRFAGKKAIQDTISDTQFIRANTVVY